MEGIKISKIVVAAAAGLSPLRSNQSKVANMILSGEPTTKAEEAGNFVFLITGVVILDGMDRVE